MRSRLDTLIDLLHGAAEGALATHSLAMPGHPFATAVPFATDERQRPVLLLSSLAEHTQNLRADGRASFLVSRPLGGGEMARATLVGEVARCEPSPAQLARYLRYRPESERFLQLGDFGFYRLEPARIRIVGGFAQAGWLDGRQLLDAPAVAPGDESRLIGEADDRTGPDWRLLGVDRFGLDWQIAGQRVRIPFENAPVAMDALAAAMRQATTRMREEAGGAK